MKPELTHEQAFAELDAVAFDLLDTVERDAVLAHVETCDACQAELDALRETAAELAFAARFTPPMAVSYDGIRERVLARAASERLEAYATPPAPSPLTRPPLLFPVPPTPAPAPMPAQRGRQTQLLAVAAGVLLVANIATLTLAVRGRVKLGDALTAQSTRETRAERLADSLAVQLAARDSLIAGIAGIAGRDVSVLTLASSVAKDPYARMFWDRSHHTWTMIAHNMPALRAGRTYQLWLVTPKAKISAGTFNPVNGDAIVRATYDLTDPLQALAVTEEAAGGAPQPTGAPVVAATNTR